MASIMKEEDMKEIVDNCDTAIKDPVWISTKLKNCCRNCSYQISFWRSLYYTSPRVVTAPHALGTPGAEQQHTGM